MWELNLNRPGKRDAKAFIYPARMFVDQGAHVLSEGEEVYTRQLGLKIYTDKFGDALGVYTIPESLESLNKDLETAALGELPPSIP